MEMLSHKILEKTFFKFPNIIYSVREIILEFLQEQKEKCRYILESVVDMHINYLFTNDYDYLTNYTTFIPKQQEKEKLDTKNIFIREIRNRIEAYFRLILRNLRDEVPKAIGTFLVKGITDNIQLYLYNKIYQGNEIMESLSESDHITQKRISLTKTLSVLKQASKEISKNKDLMDVMNINISVEREENRDGKSMKFDMNESSLQKSVVVNSGNELKQQKTNVSIIPVQEEKKKEEKMKNFFGDGKK